MCFFKPCSKPTPDCTNGSGISVHAVMVIAIGAVTGRPKTTEGNKSSFQPVQGKIPKFHFALHVFLRKVQKIQSDKQLSSKFLKYFLKSHHDVLF